jgi:hypothetical protein
VLGKRKRLGTAIARLAERHAVQGVVAIDLV